MTERTTRTSVTFHRSFSLAGLDGVQPAGTYRVEAVDVTLDGMSFIAYRRASTAIELPAVGSASLRRQVVAIDPIELEIALETDRAGSP